FKLLAEVFHQPAVAFRDAEGAMSFNFFICLGGSDEGMNANSLRISGMKCPPSRAKKSAKDSSGPSPSKRLNSSSTSEKKLQVDNLPLLKHQSSPSTSIGRTFSASRIRRISGGSP